MKQIFIFLLIIHVIAATISLISGTIQMFRQKGDVLHKNIGKYFFFGMLFTGISGILMSLIHFNLFLSIIGIFTIYMVATGQRFLAFKTIYKVLHAGKIDWIISIIMLMFSFGFIVYGLVLLINSNSFGSVLIVFGSISILMVLQDFRIYRGNSRVKNFWLLVHFQRMIGAYIAAITAFIVVNNTYLPGIIAWLLPSVIIVPFIIIWSKKYKIIKNYDLKTNTQKSKNDNNNN